jgi:hypothetical protein
MRIDRSSGKAAVTAKLSEVSCMSDEFSAFNYKTVRLAKGKHRSAQHGVCVMELASMIAGGPFTDHPASVSPVIGAFLRVYNDSVRSGGEHSGREDNGWNVDHGALIR